MALPQFVSETQLVRRVAANPECRFRWTKHSLVEVAKERWTATDVEYSLTNCQVTLVEWKKDVLYRSVGTSLDGDRIEAVVAVFENEIVIKVVTVF